MIKRNYVSLYGCKASLFWWHYGCSAMILVLFMIWHDETYWLLVWSKVLYGTKCYTLVGATSRIRTSHLLSTCTFLYISDISVCRKATCCAARLPESKDYLCRKATCCAARLPVVPLGYLSRKAICAARLSGLIGQSVISVFGFDTYPTVHCDFIITRYYSLSLSHSVILSDSVGTSLRSRPSTLHAFLSA